MSETASRRLFLAGFVLLAMPSVCILVAQAVTFGGMAIFGAGAVLVQTLFGSLPVKSLNDAWTILQLLGVFVAGAAIACLGLFAVGRFLTVALSFWRHGRPGLIRTRRYFRQGLACAVVPFLITLRIGWVMAGGEHVVDAVFGLYLSGLALLPSIMHLWIELGRAETVAS